MIDKIDELLDFLKFSFHKKKGKIAILFKLFDEDIDNITRIVSICIDNNSLSLGKCESGEYDSEITIKKEIFINMYSDSLSVFKLCKLMFRSNDIKMKNFTISKFRNFISRFDFGTETWTKFNS